MSKVALAAGGGAVAAHYGAGGRASRRRCGVVRRIARGPPAARSAPVRQRSARGQHGYEPTGRAAHALSSRVGSDRRPWDGSGGAGSGVVIVLSAAARQYGRRLTPVKQRARVPVCVGRPGCSGGGAGVTAMVSLDQGSEQCGKQERRTASDECDHVAMRGELKPETEPAVAAEAGRGEPAGVESEPDPASAEYDDFAMPVAGKSRVVRGRGWRGADGEYVRYKCFDDNIEYLPGGESRERRS